MGCNNGQESAKQLILLNQREDTVDMMYMEHRVLLQEFVHYVQLAGSRSQPLPASS